VTVLGDSFGFFYVGSMGRGRASQLFATPSIGGAEHGWWVGSCQTWQPEIV